MDDKHPQGGFDMVVSIQTLFGDVCVRYKGSLSSYALKSAVAVDLGKLSESATIAVALAELKHLREVKP